MLFFMAQSIIYRPLGQAFLPIQNSSGSNENKIKRNSEGYTFKSLAFEPSTLLQDTFSIPPGIGPLKRYFVFYMSCFVFVLL